MLYGITLRVTQVPDGEEVYKKVVQLDTGADTIGGIRACLNSLFREVYKLLTGEER